jgi:hypothetical protein
VVGRNNRGVDPSKLQTQCREVEHCSPDASLYASTQKRITERYSQRPAMQSLLPICKTDLHNFVVMSTTIEFASSVYLHQLC